MKKNSKKKIYRKWLFSIVAIALAITVATAVLKILEKAGAVSTLRQDDAVAYGPIGFLKKKRTEQGKSYQLNDPAMINQPFLAEKPKNTFRVFITGGSFAMGFPYVAQNVKHQLPGDIASWSQAELDLRYPSQKFEWINAAAGGQNSNRVRAIVEKIAELDLDLMVVAMGNNEGFVPKTNLNKGLHRWIVYRFLKKNLFFEPSLSDRPSLTRAFAAPEVIEDNFQKNVDGIMRACKKSNIPLVIATLPINYRFSNSDLPADDPDFLKATEENQYGNCEAVHSTVQKSNFSNHSDLWAGRCYESKGEFRKAKTFYRAYVQHEPLNRMRPSFNRYIREAANENNVLLVDLEKAFDGLSETGIGNSGLFLDYCHLNWRGYHFAAQILVKAIVDNRLIEAQGNEPAAQPSIDKLIKKNGWEVLLSDIDLTILRSNHPPSDI